MKRLLILLLCLLLVGCGTNKNSNDDSLNYEKEASDTIEEPKNVMEIKDNVFIQMTNDMYLNPKDYKNQNLQIEGLIYTDEYDDETHIYIIRRTPGCCGSDGLAGLEVYWDGDVPEDDVWVIGKGTWKESKDSTYNGWILVLYSLEIGEPGKEFLEYNY